MKSIKHVLSIAVMIITIHQFLYAVGTSLTLYENTHEKQAVSFIYKDEIEKDTEKLCYRAYIRSKTYIPEKFKEPFINATIDDIPLGIELLGTAYHESGWRVFRGKRNENGSVDHGPLMLNSHNIENEYFMRVFGTGCNQYIDDLNIYYMLICINYYKSIRKTLGPYHALMVYNGGHRAITRRASDKLRAMTTLYANMVFSYINNYQNEWREFKARNFKFYENFVIYKYVNIHRSEMERSMWSLPDSRFREFDSFRELTKNYISYFGLHFDYHYDRKFLELYILQKWPTKRYIVPVGDSRQFVLLNVIQTRRVS